MHKLRKRMEDINEDLLQHLISCERDFEVEVIKTLKNVNKNRKSKITAAAGMGVLAFFSDGEPISLGDYIKPLQNLENLWTYSVDNFNYYMVLDKKCTQ